MWATGALAVSADHWLKVSALALAPFALLVAWLLHQMSGRRALLFAAAPALVLYSFHNWDLLVVAAATAAIWLWWKGRPGWAGVLLGVGAAFKMYPLFFLAPLFLERLWARDARGAFQAAGAGAGTFLLVNLPFALVNFDGWIATYTFHRDRGPNYDSIWALGWPAWSPDRVNLVTAALTGVFFLAVLAYGGVRAERDGRYPVVSTCGALLVVFLLWNKVHSPQYTLWLLPFFVLLRVHIGWWIAYAIADLAAYVGVFRFFYDFGAGVSNGWAEDLMIGGVWLRAALLGAGLLPVFLSARSALEDEETAAQRAVPAVSAGG